MLGVVLILAAGAGAMYLRDGLVNVFRCHAGGVSRVNRLGVTALGYGEIGSFTYSATRMYDDGSYAGTNLVLLFEQLEGWDKLSVSYHAIVHNADGELERLREFVSRVIFGRVVSTVAPDQPELRAALCGTQIAGLGMVRYIIRLEPLASADPDTVVATIAPNLQRYLTGKL